MQFFVTCHFQKLVVFLAVKMAAYEELITHIYTLFCPFYTIGKTSLGYQTLLEKIKAVCAWNSLKASVILSMVLTNHRYPLSALMLQPTAPNA